MHFLLFMFFSFFVINMLIIAWFFVGLISRNFSLILENIESFTVINLDSIPDIELGLKDSKKVEQPHLNVEIQGKAY